MTIGTRSSALWGRLGLRPLRPESETFLHLDGLRFIAASGIVALHFAGGLEWPSAWAWLHGRLATLSLFVDVFFCLSGIVIASLYGERMGSAAQYGEFLKRRAARLLPLHWATALFYVAAGGLLLLGVPVGDSERYDWACLPANLALVHAFGTCQGPFFNGVSWSISAEFGMYAAFPLFLWLCGHVRAAWALPVAAGLALALLGPWWNWTYDAGVLRAVPAFLYGLVLHGQRHRLARWSSAPAFYPLAVAAFLTAGPAGTPRPLILLLGYFAVAAAYGADLRGSAGPIVRRLAPLGRLTYGIYMLHPLVESVAIATLGERLLGLTGGGLVAWVLMCALCVPLLAYLSLMLFETPARRALNRPWNLGAGVAARERKRPGRRRPGPQED